MSAEPLKAAEPADAELAELALRIFADVAAMSPDVKGVSRPAFSPVESRVLDYFEELARSHDLCCWRDPGDNLVIAGRGDSDRNAPAGYFGSHVDSVPEGGNYDGLAGVTAALLTLIALERDRVKPRLPLRVLALRGEESAWFGQAYMGSLALFGRLGEAALSTSRRDGRGTLRDAMHETGLPVDRIARGEPLIDADKVRFFIEAHIEQGPVLVDRGWPVAIVTGIRGNIRHRAIECIGEAGHSGAVPRWLRRDAVFAVAELITRMDEHWATIQQHGGDLVLTFGILHTDPAHHAMSRIPGEATFSFEGRSQDPATLLAVEGLLRSECQIIERERKVKFRFDPMLRAEPAEMDTDLVATLLAACTAEQLPAETIPSGAGHDAAVFAQAGVPAGMIFIRNRNGSHNPAESMEIDDLMCAVAVMRRVAKELTR